MPETDSWPSAAIDTGKTPTFIADNIRSRTKFPDLAAKYVMNGKEQPEAMNLKVGTRYRFRLFNLAGDTPTLVSINAGEAPVAWRAVAKDGYPLPASQATNRPAVLFFDPGEIYDYEFTPTAPGELTLKFGPPPPPPNQPPPPPGLPFQPPPPTVSVAIHVR